jgi:hypothetical protein
LEKVSHSLPDSNAYAVWKVKVKLKYTRTTWNWDERFGKLVDGDWCQRYWFCDVSGIGILERLLDGLMLKQRM